jgi:hypothetical protein
VRWSAPLFEELYVKDGAIVGWKPRVEGAAEVERLMDSVREYGEQSAELA